MLGPLILAAQSLDDVMVGLGHHLLGGALMGEWLAASAANVVLSPLYAIPAVLITLRLIGHPRQFGASTRN